MACPAFGQARKPMMLTPKDYGLWSLMHSEGISDYGGWVQYTLHYDSGMDTLFVRSTNKKKVYSFPKGTSGTFNGDLQFGCLLPGNRLNVINLKTGISHLTDDVQDFTFVNGGKNLLVHCTDQDGRSWLAIKNEAGVTTKYIDSINSFTVNADLDAVVYCRTENGVKIAAISDFKNGFSEVVLSKDESVNYGHFVWSKAGNYVAFTGLNTNTLQESIFVFDVRQQRLISVGSSDKEWMRGFELNVSSTSAICVSDDGKRVFFLVKGNGENSKANSTPAVEVWNASDKIIYPGRQYNLESAGGIAVWKPETNEVQFIGGSGTAFKAITSNFDFVITYDCAPYLPTNKIKADKDYYLTDVSTGQSVLFLKQQPGETDNFLMSPSGNYLTYYRDKNWWAYNLKLKVHNNLTRDCPTSFADELYSNPEDKSPLSVPVWGNNDDIIFLSDRNDVWRFERGKFKKLTDGVKKDLGYKVWNDTKAKRRISALVLKSGFSVNPDTGIILKATAGDFSRSGFYKLSAGKTEVPIVMDEKHISGLVKAKNMDSYLFRQESYESSPELVYLSHVKNAPETLFKSNPQQSKYAWGKQTVINYKNRKGEDLSGLLIYPADFDAAKQYPMIVKIYERQLRYNRQYVIPSDYNSDGYNAAKFSTQGYFVLMPDIVYEVGEPGASAVDCVVAATEAAISTGFIDTAKIGLMGHSFGAYETNFIITKTKLFAAAVSGNGVADFTSNYLSIIKNYRIPNAWRYEHDQSRIGKSLFDDLEIYQRNSPINFAKEVVTPLLIWRGEKDPQVNPAQGLAFYLALRRLEKICVMLNFPEEEHSIESRENQLILNERVSEWFGYYLKKEKMPEWAKPSMEY